MLRYYSKQITAVVTALVVGAIYLAYSFVTATNVQASQMILSVGEPHRSYDIPASTVYGWINAVPVMTDDVNYQWINGRPYIIIQSTTSSVPIISNNSSSYTLNSDAGGSGKVLWNTIYYSNPLGSTTSPTVGGVTDSECEWLLTNTSGMAIDLTCTMTDFSGGSDNSVNSNNGANGATSYGVKSFFSGQDSGNWTIIKTASSDVGYTNLASSTNIKWGIILQTQSNMWTGPTAASANLTITATVH